MLASSRQFFFFFLVRVCFACVLFVVAFNFGVLGGVFCAFFFFFLVIGGAPKMLGGARKLHCREIFKRREAFVCLIHLGSSSVS